VAVAVLVIEDDRDLAESVRRGLIAEGYAVELAHDGDRGLELGRSHPYQAIILDLMLPGLNGYRLCAALRREQVSTPVLILTAKDGEYDEADALDLGADDYLCKPFSYIVLVARLRALIRRGGAGRSPELRVGDLLLDPARRSCRRGAVPVALTAKEFAVLACLARRPGEVVSKIEIIDEVWDTAFDGDVNIVEVYIRTLRRKIDLPFDRQTIETVRGAGYRLVDGRG
jgi:DNA-binding response OmpR family regulator